jgi:mannose-6-phosphate isomerase-like protein (cupin superfamily)
MRLVVLFVVSAVWLAAADPEGFAQWKSAELKAAAKKLAAKIDQKKFASEALGSFGNHSLQVAHREGNGEAELHETQADVFVVESGEATLVVGGTMVEPRSTAPHELRGPSIQGGISKRLEPGDVVHIAPKTPHQLMIAAGKQFTYAVVKVDSGL